MNTVRAPSSVKRSGSKGRSADSGVVGRVAEHDPEVRVGGDRQVVARPEQADVDALVHRLEQPRERLGA